MNIRVGIKEGNLVGNSKAVIQRALDVVGLNGGGTVEVGPGVYTLTGALHMKTGVKLTGAGRETILRRCDGPVTPLAMDGDVQQTKVTVVDVSGFQPDMDVLVQPTSGGHNESYGTITYIEGNTLYLDRRLRRNYFMDCEPMVFCGFPLIMLHGVSMAAIENICLDGNRHGTPFVSTWETAGIHIYESSYCRISDCYIQNTNADGIVGSVNHDIVIERNECTENRCFGIHLGSGSTRALVRKNNCTRNGMDGIYLCWRVQESRYENNDSYENDRYGICLGSKGSNNVFVGNTFRNNKSHGIYFRGERADYAANHNTLRKNTIQDNGDCGIYIEPETHDVLFEGNIIGDTRPKGQRTQRIGIFAAEGISNIRSVGNEFGPHTAAAMAGKVEKG